MKLALSCPIQRPDDLKAGQFVHPLPVNRDDDNNHGYLFKETDGYWYMDMTPESYKTGATYGAQKLKIPNEPLADGKCFYDYLEAFLYGYYRDAKGNWWSGGQLTDTDAHDGRWFILRMSFNPTHNYVFVQPRTGDYYRRVSAFTKLLTASSNRLTGQRLPPHLLRSIFATWFLDQGYTPERIASLAYALGQSEAVLRRLYDRRKSTAKTRPIEAVLSHLQRFSLR